jgi:drug/metabolite transporter (DMT)-like permease
MGASDWALLASLSVLWGGTFYFVAIAVRELPPFTIVLCRVALAAIALHVLLAAMGRSMPWRREAIIAFLGMGLLNNVLPFSLIVFGQREIASGLASILNATTPLFTVVVAHLTTPNERLTRLKALGVAVGFCGVVVMVGGGALTGLGGTTGELLVLGAALSYAFAGVFGRRFRRMAIGPVETAAG